jgi:hypothetical protein
MGSSRPRNSTRAGSARFHKSVYRSGPSAPRRRPLQALAPKGHAVAGEGQP